MSGYTFWYLGGGTARGNTTLMSTFFKIPSLPSSRITLLDVDAGGAGHNRISIDTAGKLWQEQTIYGSTNVEITQGTPLPLNAWIWLSTAMNDSFAGTYVRCYLLSGGVTLNDVTTTLSAGHQESAVGVSARCGIGVSLTSAYANWPNTSGYRITKPHSSRSSTWPGNPPIILGAISSDWGSGGDWTFNVRGDTVGAHTTLTDASGAGLTQTVSPEGLTVYLDGPYP